MEKIEIKESFLSLMIIRLLLMVWMGFAMLKYQLNPFFFGLTILVAMVLFVMKSRLGVSIQDRNFIITKHRLLPFLNYKKVIPIYEIEEVKFEEGQWSFLRMVLDFIGNVAGAFGNEPSYLFIKLAGAGWQRMQAPGDAKEYDLLLKRIEELKN